MNRPHPHWTPLLAGREAERAWDAVHEIARELPRQGEELLRERPGRQMGLSGGKAGFALFFGYLAQVSGEDEHAETAARYLDEATEAVAEEATVPDLYGGFTGVAWVAEHLTGRVFEEEDEAEDGNAAVDEALADLLEQSPWRHDYDLIRGLIGFGIYGLERRHRPGGRTILERVVARLDELAVRDGDRLAWHTPPHVLPPHQREQSPEGYFNVGVAHGLPAALPLLARAAAAGVAEATARDLLRGAVRWLLNEKDRVEGDSCFPYSIGADGSRVGSRLAWCYGDLGIAAALLDAAVASGESEWREDALDLARRCAERSEASAGVHDASLCHGAAGNGHVFNRLYQGSRDEALGEAARTWFERTWRYRRADTRVAGFATWGAEVPGADPRWQDDASFLTGAAGVGLALLAAVSEVIPDWDRVLAISVPPAAG